MIWVILLILISPLHIKPAIIRNLQFYIFLYPYSAIRSYRDNLHTGDTLLAVTCLQYWNYSTHCFSESGGLCRCQPNKIWGSHVMTVLLKYSFTHLSSASTYRKQMWICKSETESLKEQWKVHINPWWQEKGKQSSKLLDYAQGLMRLAYPLS